MTLKDCWLNLPGGGVRGALQNRPLMRLEKMTGKLCKDIFKGVGCTSVGSDIGAAIACGVPTTVIADMFRQKTPRIFSPGAPWNDINLLRRGYRYDIGNLHQVLHETLGPSGDLPLNSFPTKILITAKGADGHQWYFTQDSPKNASLTGSVKLIDACCASSAAVTYFQFYPVPGFGLMTDGGLGVSGNPVYEFAYELFAYNGYTPENSIMISIGTGRNPPPKAPDTDNLLSEVKWLISTLLYGPEAQAPELVRRHYPTLNFQEFDIDLATEIALDQAANVPALEAYGEKLADQMNWEKILA